MKKKLNYLVVIGGAGFIGSNLIKLLLKKTKKKIISLDNYSTGLIKNHIKHKNVYYKKENSQNIRTLNKLKNKIEVIFHLGEFSRLYQSYEDINKCIQSNITGSQEVFKFCYINNIRLIYTGTSIIYGSKKNENLSPYAWTKTHNINLLENLKKWFNLRYDLANFNNIYGPNQIKNSKMSSVVSIFQEQRKKKNFLTVVKPGTQKRNFTHVEDACEGLYKIYKICSGNGKSYHLNSKKLYRVLDIAKMFSNKIVYLKKRKGENFKNYSNTYKANKELKFKPRHDLKKYIEEFINENHI